MIGLLAMLLSEYPTTKIHFIFCPHTKTDSYQQTNFRGSMSFSWAELACARGDCLALLVSDTDLLSCFLPDFDELAVVTLAVDDVVVVFGLTLIFLIFFPLPLSDRCFRCWCRGEDAVIGDEGTENLAPSASNELLRWGCENAFPAVAWNPSCWCG